MESENETVEQVCESMRDSADRLSLSAPAISSALRCYSEDILAAHKREVEELSKRLAAVEAERDEMRKQMLEELGRADIIENQIMDCDKRIAELKKVLDAVQTDLKDIVEGSGDALHGALATILGEVIKKCEVKK